jgi:hypothetical protein
VCGGSERAKQPNIADENRGHSSRVAPEGLFNQRPPLCRARTACAAAGGRGRAAVGANQWVARAAPPFELANTTVLEPGRWRAGVRLSRGSGGGGGRFD